MYSRPPGNSPTSGETIACHYLSTSNWVILEEIADSEWIGKFRVVESIKPFLVERLASAKPRFGNVRLTDKNFPRFLSSQIEVMTIRRSDRWWTGVFHSCADQGTPCEKRIRHRMLTAAESAGFIQREESRFRCLDSLSSSRSKFVRRRETKCRIRTAC
jgi:hypothetical protein